METEDFTEYNWYIRRNGKIQFFRNGKRFLCFPMAILAKDGDLTIAKVETIGEKPVRLIIDINKLSDPLGYV